MIGRLRAAPGPARLEEAMRVRGVWNVDRAQAALNVFGGAAFAVGSLLFLNSALQRWGIVLFVVGSFGMFAGALAVWNERYAPRRHHPTANAQDAGYIAGYESGAGTRYDVAAAPLTPAHASAPATVTLPVATHAPASVTSPAAPGSRPATPRGD